MQREAGLAVALVNLATPQRAGGRTHEPARGDDLATRFGERLTPAWAARLGGVTAAGSRLERLAGALREVFAAGSPARRAELVNALLRRHRPQPYLTEDVGQPLHLHFHGDDSGTAVEALASELVFALALVIDSYGFDRLGICEARECDRVYVDLTRNGSRRYCGDACGARAKMAAHRARRAAKAVRP